jgi:sec-independent protein translocase protein TatA
MPIGFHPFELIIILVVALLIFGPKRLPEMGSSIGKGIKEFRKGMSELTSPSEDEDVKSKSAASLEAIEREIAEKKAAAAAIDRELAEKRAAASEAAQPEVSATPEEAKAETKAE